MVNLYEIALVDNSKMMINLSHIESIKSAEDDNFVTLTMASGTEMDVIPQTLNLALQHSKSEIFRLSQAAPKEEEQVKEVEGELVD